MVSMYKESSKPAVAFILYIKVIHYYI